MPLGTTLPKSYQPGGTSAGSIGQGALTTSLNGGSQAAPRPQNNYVQYAPGQGPGASPLDQYLQSAWQMQNSDFSSQQSSLAAQRAAASAMAGANLSAARSGAAVALAGADNDRWRANSLWDLLNSDADARTGFTNEQFAELARNVSANRGFAGRDLEIRQWLNQQNQGFNTRGRDLAFGEAALAYDRSTRQARSDATARGARTSRGFFDTVDEFGRERTGREGQATLSYDSRNADLQAQGRTDRLNYEQAMEALLNQYNNGEIDWRSALHAIDQMVAEGGVQNQYANRNADLQGISARNSVNAATAQANAQRAAANAQYSSQVSALNTQQRQALLALQQMGLR